MRNGIKAHIFFVLSLIQTVFGQTTKVYNGNFNSRNFKGSSSYSYYENNSQQRIFEGKFVFNALNNVAGISGAFHDDLKNGKWEITINNFVLPANLMVKGNLTASVIGTYLNGNMEGKWTLKRTKIITFQNNTIANYYKPNTFSNGKPIDYSKPNSFIEVATANFKNNHFSGALTYSINGGEVEVKGQFNDNGYCEGVWIITYYEKGILYTQTSEYKNGVLLFIKNKDNSTGEIKTIYDESEQVNEFFQNYNEVDNFAKVGYKYLKLSEGQSSKNEVALFDDAISMWCGNSSLMSSAYTFEIEKGSNKMTVYPERIIITHESKRIEEEQNEKERAMEIQKNEETKKRENDKKSEEDKKLIESKRFQEQELESEKQRKIAEFNNTDYGRLKEQIKAEYRLWLTKSDFETSIEYKERIKNKWNEALGAITNKAIKSSKDNCLAKNMLGKLGVYNIEKEEYSITINDIQDSIFIKVLRNMALVLSDDLKPVNSKEQYFCNEIGITIFPIEVVMNNNKWQITKASIILNSGCKNGGHYEYFGSSKPILTFKGDKVYLNGQYQPPSGKYKLKDFSEFVNKEQDAIYYYKWDISQQSNYDPSSFKTMTFNLEDLGLTLPTF